MDYQSVVSVLAAHCRQTRGAEHDSLVSIYEAALAFANAWTKVPASGSAWAGPQLTEREKSSLAYRRSQDGYGVRHRGRNE